MVMVDFPDIPHYSVYTIISNNNIRPRNIQMTRYFYFPHSDKELPVASHYALDRLVWILDTARHLPMAIRLIDTSEDWLLFETEDACIAYYEITTTTKESQ
mgnify:CR=1 FL=1